MTKQSDMQRHNAVFDPRLGGVRVATALADVRAKRRQRDALLTATQVQELSDRELVETIDHRSTDDGLLSTELLTRFEDAREALEQYQAIGSLAQILAALAAARCLVLAVDTSTATPGGDASTQADIALDVLKF